MNAYKVIGENIRKRRKQLHLTQEQLSEMCGFSRSYIGIIERGLKKFSIEALIKISNQLHVSLNYLAGELVDNYNLSFKDEMAQYLADVPKEKLDSLKSIIKTISVEYSKK
ncbi:MAG: helix-turn-helix transcriptional regulator [Clostridia bacterium]|nr:helix-turn-helix transcriptional regulator [Clostridia bacterium]